MSVNIKDGNNYILTFRKQQYVCVFGENAPSENNLQVS